MSFEEIERLENEAERVSAIYDIFDEATRFDSQAARVEFLTTIKYIESYLKPGMRILDLGAGTGRYSLYFANKGYEVVAVELVKKHVEAIECQKEEGINLTVLHGNVIEELTAFLDKTFDLVLCLGPLYHLAKKEDRELCVREVKRVCKKDGKMFFAFINNDMVIVTQTMFYDPNYLEQGNYNRETFKVKDFPFVFDTVDSARDLLRGCGLTIEKEIAADGMSELLAEKISSLTKTAYQQWLRYHFYVCEKPEFLGASNHLLFVCK
ncbi:MAG: class I SAM-dependent methyltransferase [Firmicutes bacterium]|nr:class I SAM-dependent methyltransferase [Bacillota bacterium]